MEVAEHLEDKYSDILVKSLVSSSSTIVFSAATQGQGGIGHVNEQPHMWWIRKFDSFGFKLDEEQTKALRMKMRKTDIPYYYTNNLLVLKE